MTVGRPHHRDLDALIPQPCNSTGPLSFNHGSPLELEAQLDEELDRRVHVVDYDSDIIQSSYCHRFRPV